jgi:hypothetical protein
MRAHNKRRLNAALGGYLIGNERMLVLGVVRFMR